MGREVFGKLGSIWHIDTSSMSPIPHTVLFLSHNLHVPQKQMSLPANSLRGKFPGLYQALNRCKNEKHISETEN